MELCPKTLEELKVARLHFHVGIEAEKEVRISSAQVLGVMGVAPFLSGGSGSNMARMLGSPRGGRRENSSAALHFYCQVQKIGQLFNAGSLTKYHDFAVKPQWVQKLFTACKVDAVEASRAFLSCFSGAKMNLANLDLVRQRDQEESDEAARLRILKDVATQQRQFKPQPEIDPWLQQYRGLAQERYKVLVLVGKSRTG